MHGQPSIKSGGRQTQSVHFAKPGFYKTWEKH